MNLWDFLKSQFNSPAKVTSGIAGSAAALAMAVNFIGGLEGLRTTSYKDVVGVWTYCYGETQGAKPGQTYTVAQCDALLKTDILTYESQLNGCISDAIEPKIPQSMKISLVSFAYNVGVPAACGSTLMRFVNAGQFVQACNQLALWNRGGGRIIQGLVNRRVDEKALCLSDLK